MNTRSHLCQFLPSSFGRNPALVNLVITLVLQCGAPAQAQDRLKTMPGYAHHEAMKKVRTDVITPGPTSVQWVEGGAALEYKLGKQSLRFDVDTGLVSEVRPPGTNAAANGAKGKAASSENTNRFAAPPRPGRARQYAAAVAPDGSMKAFYRNCNLWLTSGEDSEALAITTDGSEATRRKYGTGTWVYGEELDQNTAIWWSSNSLKVAFYGFDESSVPRYYLALDQTKIQSRLDQEAYPKAGAPNPVPDLYVYDVEQKATVRIDVRNGEPFSDAVLGHYVYGVSWTADSRELLFHRTNRRQNILELCAADPASGRCRVILREEWLPSYTDNSPEMRFLADGRRFIWETERTGWKNYRLYDLSGKQLAILTDHCFEVDRIVHVDESAGWLYYLARSGDNPKKIQLHRVGLDGTGDRRLTDPAFHHTIRFAPDGRHYVDTAQTHDSPPITRLVRADGQVLAELGRADLTRFRQAGLKTVELLEFKAADNQTTLYGKLHFPSNFDPRKKYPLLVGVYAGPATSGSDEIFTMPDELTEYGFLVASFDSRSSDGRGKRFLDAFYRHFGTIEIDDQAAGVKSLWSRPYLDKSRVGIHGTSYGGTASVMCLLRYPEVFHAAASSAPVTDFRNYDSIYTERNLWLPQEGKDVYDAASLMPLASKLQGRLMLFFGTADDNVHPSNALQFIQALQRAGKSFEVQVGPDVGHAAMNHDRMMEFFIENLVMNPKR